MEVLHAGMLEAQTRLGVRQQAAQLVGMIRPSVPDPEEVQSDINALPFVVLSVGSERSMAVTLVARSKTFIKNEGRVVHYVLQVAQDETFATLCVPGAQCGGLFIDLRQRQRYRINGRVGQFKDGVLSVEVGEALPNCPKYIQARVPDVACSVAAQRRVSSKAAALSERQQQWVAQCDTFFLGSLFGRADATHRGGRPGFVRVASPSELRWGEYQGNNLNMTIGNMIKCATVAIAVPDWSSGAMLHVSGTARLDFDAHLDGSAVTVVLTIAAVEEVENCLSSSFRLVDRSPYNPPLGGERAAAAAAAEGTIVTLRQIIVESPCVKSFLFEGPVGSVSPGQHAVFELPLNLGSRTWTVTRAGPNMLGITVKLNPELSRGGSLFLHRRAGVGTRVVLKAVENGPFANVSGKILFLTAGIGITPAIAAVRRGGAQVSVLHFDGVGEQEVPCWPEVAKGAKKALLCTQPNRVSLTAELIKQFDFDRVFLCGPQRFMDAATDVLKTLGIAPVTESFSF
jgi:ferredoxin-NADP reductase